MTTRADTPEVASLVAVHSPDDGGWYCEIWRHHDDQKRTVIDHETADNIHQSADLALAEGRERCRRAGLRVFWSTINDA